MPGRDPCQMLLELLATMQTLRAPGGCPWDAAQSPESLAPYILEEACEAIEAIEHGSPAMIADELGDLLLQIVFQAEIFSQRGLFDFADVAAGINAKLLRRHPHVFANHNTTGDMEELAKQWEQIKSEEHARRPPSYASPPGHPPKHLPALQRAQKLVSRAWRIGFVHKHLLSRQECSTKLTEEELGAALLSLVHHAECSGLDAEQTLQRVLQNILPQPEHSPPET